MELKTPLYDAHVKAGGKTVPLRYHPAGTVQNRRNQRTHGRTAASRIFDVSHMGEILCEGEKALENLQHLLTNDFTNMVDGQARYSPMCNEHGGTVDDLIVYKKADNHYFIVVNAANKDKDFQWMLGSPAPGSYLHRRVRPVCAAGSAGNRKQWRSFADLRRKTRSRRNTTTQYSTGKSAGMPVHHFQDGIHGRRRCRALRIG